MVKLICLKLKFKMYSVLQPLEAMKFYIFGTLSHYLSCH